MRYTITGGAGFTGSNFADALLAEKHEVHLVDNLERAGAKINLAWLREKWRDKVHFHEADIRTDRKTLDEVIGRADVVFHLAAQVAVTTSVTDPRHDFETNALGSFNVLEAARRSARPPIVIYASTNKVYGGMEDVRTSETTTRYDYIGLPNGVPETRPLDFHSPYGCSKGAADQYVRDYSRIYGLRTVVMRQSCIYGPRQFGIEDQGWVAWFVIAAVTGRPITIYGTGKQVRDVLHVHDLFRAYQSAVARIDRVNGSIFNLGGGRKNTLSLLEMLAMLEKQLGRKTNYSTAGPRPGDQPVYISDISRAARELDWAPAIGVEQGIRGLVDWVRENAELFRSPGTKAA